MQYAANSVIFHHVITQVHPRHVDRADLISDGWLPSLFRSSVVDAVIVAVAAAAASAGPWTSLLSLLPFPIALRGGLPWVASAVSPEVLLSGSRRFDFRYNQ